MSRGFLWSLLPLGILGLAVFIFAWFVDNHAPWPIEVRTPPDPEVLRNPHLAAQRVLEKLGVDSEIIESFRQAELPEPPATLVILPSRRVLTEARSQELLDWVRRGGHLVLGAQPSDELFELDAEGEPYLDPILSTVGIWPMNTESTATLTVFVSGGRAAAETLPLEIVAPRMAHLSRDEEAEGELILGMGTETVDLALRVALDEGAITVLGVPAIMRNAWLDRGDNALALWEMVVFHSDGAPVWIVPELAPPQLAELIWSRASAVVISLLVLIAAWVISYARRLGPVAPDPEPIRRGLEEHILATGRLIHRAGAQQHLVRAALARLDADVRRRTPGWTRLSEAEQHRRLASLTKMSRGTIAAVLKGDGRDGFDERIRRIEAIRRSL